MFVKYYPEQKEIRACGSDGLTAISVAANVDGTHNLVVYRRDGSSFFKANVKSSETPEPGFIHVEIPEVPPIVEPDNPNQAV